MFPIEVRINKEVRDYQESLFFGLSLRQFLFALLAVLVAVGLYFGLRNVVDGGEIGWICVLAAFPFALCGREGFVLPKSVQDAIPIRRLWPDGIFQFGSKLSKTIRFSDISRTA